MGPLKALELFFHSGLGVVSAVVVTLGALVNLIEKSTKLKNLVGFRSLADLMHDEETRIRDTMRLMKELEAQNTQESRAAREKLEESLNSMLARLAALIDRDRKLREDPNYGLNFIRRLFLLFSPEGQTVFIPQSLAHICMLAVPLSILLGSHLGQPLTREYIADTLLLGGYGTLIFRAWALAARRWGHAYDTKTGLWGNIFLLRRPGSRWMMVAQIFFWICIFWVVESVEDLCLDTFGKVALPPLGERMLKSLVPLVVAILCRFWAAAELKYAGQPSIPGWRLARFCRFGWSTLAMIVYGAMIACAVVIVDFKPGFLHEPLHKIAFILQAVISLIVCSQWLSLISQFASVATEAAPVRVKATIA